MKWLANKKVGDAEDHVIQSSLNKELKPKSVNQ